MPSSTGRNGSRVAPPISTGRMKWSATKTTTDPATAMTPNQTTITGPKTRPTAAVPRRWTTKSATMITAVIGTTHSPSGVPA